MEGMFYGKNMIKRKIYVISAGKKNNGGGETLHQLVDAINNYGVDAYIFYADEKLDSVVKEMRKYNIKYASYVEDRDYNITICPEMYTKYIYRYKHVKKIIWFLSKDYYLLSRPEYRTNVLLKKYQLPFLFYPLMYVFTLLFTYASLKTFLIEKEESDLFLYNCEYARQYIDENAKKRHISLYLCGPINDIYFKAYYGNSGFKKERIVAFNPTKATEYTYRLIDYFKIKNSNIEFIPIKNLSQTAVCNLLTHAAVYMDLGTFPGPERLPREAVLMGCNIITSNLGSTTNEKDVPIPTKYKFKMSEDNLEKISCAIIELVNNYEIHYKEYDDYREKVLRQKEAFDVGVRQLLSMLDENPN